MERVISDTKRPIKIWATDLEDEAETQVRNISSLPFIHSHVSVMPDAHAGRGSTIGTVIATCGAIIPACVGVDIGCGMAAVRLPFKVDRLGDLKKLRHSIERSVPTGRNSNKDFTSRTAAVWASCGKVSERAENLSALGKSMLQIGTLGGGNHFIEVCKDDQDNAWVMLHSGSRNIGKCLAEIHIERAKGLMKEYFISLPDPDLAYLAQGTTEFKDYLTDLYFAQNYARANRTEMMMRILKDISYHVENGDFSELSTPNFRVDCHHNYTQMENHFGKNIYVTRKGAISAKAGEWGIIPGSMGTRSFIVKGLGDADSFHSCSHGAGRRMSRTKARAAYSLDDLRDQTMGVECSIKESLIDEIPGAYKNIDTVMENQKDLVTPVYELKQILCVKGD